jgi:hypothetical protein
MSLGAADKSVRATVGYIPNFSATMRNPCFSKLGCVHKSFATHPASKLVCMARPNCSGVNSFNSSTF